MAEKIEKASSIVKLVYEIKDEKIITIFHPIFVRNNKSNCRMIINNKLTKLTSKYQVNDKNMKILKIKLLILNNKKINLSYMFYKCDSLKKFNLLSKEETKSEEKYNNKNHSNGNINILDLNENPFTINLDTNSKTNKSNNNKTESDYIHNNSKINNNISKNIEEQMSSIINLSHDIFSSSLSTIGFQKSNDLILSDDNSFFLKFCKQKILLEKEQLNSKDYYIIVKDIKYMFYECSSLLSITGLSKLNTSNIKNMSHLFENCSLLEKIGNINQWDINKVNNISCFQVANH